MKRAFFYLLTPFALLAAGLVSLSIAVLFCLANIGNEAFWRAES
jgi:hypothetical protein